MAKRHNMAIDWGDGDEHNLVGSMPRDMFGRPRIAGDFRNKRYIEAYGNYSGGYRPLNSPVRPIIYTGPPRRFAPPTHVLIERPIGQPRPPKQQTHEEEAIKYLIRCGVSKECVTKLPNDLLQLIKPQHCGLCGHSFDGFPASRVHYASKNHLKAQKRWVTQKSESGQLKENPIRARELYCELCDIHLTSKVQGDAHYAGRPHRAIVEGRRNPKNPMLLQVSMQGRLEKLIRREKEHIKTTPDGEPAAENPNKPKLVQTDLYCDICKTSVTCAEQMTMHLNGKRHLSKEKQHILKLMKGEIVETPGQQEAQSGTVQEEATPGSNRTLEESKEGNEPVSWDWGEGSSKWEDD